MNLGQTMITLGMFVLLMMTVISANRILIDNAETSTQTDPLASASTLASDLLAEIMSKPFDQRVVIDTTVTPWRQDITGISISSADSLSPYKGAQWGVRSLLTLPDDSSYVGKYLSWTRLKDMDDYDGYWRRATIIMGSDTVRYAVSARVYYVPYTAPDDTTATATKSFFKKVTVTVVDATHKVNQKFTALASY
jgi:hypothetical protein